MTKASKQDVEMLKRLVVEFKDELDALGVKVDKIDSRLAVIEDRLGGWKISGEFRFDAKFAAKAGIMLQALMKVCTEIPTKIASRSAVTVFGCVNTSTIR